MQLIDTHTHLYAEVFEEDQRGLVSCQIVENKRNRENLSLHLKYIKDFWLYDIIFTAKRLTVEKMLSYMANPIFPIKI